MKCRCRNPLFLAALAGALTFNASANYHLWDVAEIYSNEDGSVQFIELITGNAGQEVLAGHQIQCSGPGGTNLFTFTNNLAAGTASKTFIIGTSNLGSIPGGVKPDYIMPPNFLLRGTGATNTVNFGLGQDIVTYTNLPTNGVASLVRSGTNMIFAATNSPKNYSSQSNSIVPVKISGAAVSGTNLVFSFVAAAGTNFTTGPNYTVQFKDALNNSNWTSLATIGGGTNILTRTFTNGISPAIRFYRLSVP